MADMPHSVSSGTIRIFGVDLVTHVLSDGRRIIEADSFHALFEAMAGPCDEPGDVDELAAFLRGAR